MNVFEAAARAYQEGTPAALVTVIAASGSTPRGEGARMLVYGDGATVGTIGGGMWEREVSQLAIEAISTGKALRHRTQLDNRLSMGCGGDMEVYIEPLQRRTPLVMFGAGHVAVATAPLLVGLGYDVTIVDDRDALVGPERFPGCRVVHGDPLAFAEAMAPTPATHVLLMTHLHSRDQALLHATITRPHAWIGMLGSRRKIAHIFTALEAAGIPRDALAQVRSPIGLDIGAQTPEEIAIAVTAELIAARSGLAGPYPQKSANAASNPLRAATLQGEPLDR